MPDKKSTSIGEQASLMKKAGLPTVAVILVTVMSFPGFWEFFFNKTDDEAKVKAEVAYELLKARSEGLAKQVEQQGAQIDTLRETLNAMLLQRSALGMSMLRPPPAPEAQPEPPAAPVLKPLPANLDSAAAAVMGE